MSATRQFAAAAAFVATLVWGSAGASPASSGAPTLERGVAMPTTWLQFRLNGAHNPVIDAPMVPAWQVETHGQISASPAVVGGTVYLGTNGGILYAIDAASGKVRWTYRGRNGLKSNPLVYRGRVIVGEGNADSTTFQPRRRVRVGSGSNGIIALDARTGRPLWYHGLSGTGQPTAAIVNGVLVHHDGDGIVVALDPMTGRLLYRRNVRAVASMVGAVPLDSGLVVTTGIFPNRVIGLNRQTGTIAWTWERSALDSGLGDCPPASNGSAVFCDYLAPVDTRVAVDPGSTAREEVYSLDAATGRARWVVTLEPGVVPPRNESAIPLLYHNRLYVGSAVAPYMHAIDAQTGTVLWTRRVRGPVKGGVVARNGRVYFGDGGGYLWALDSATGRVVSSLATGTSYNVGSPVLVGGSLVIGSNTGRVAAVPLDRLGAPQNT